MRYSVDAFLAAEKRSRRKVAVVFNRVPAGLDAAHVGFIFTDVVESGHRGTPVRSNSSTIVVLTVGERWANAAQVRIAVAGNR